MSARAAVKVNLSLDEARVEVDGVNIADAVGGLHLRAVPGITPALTVDLVAAEYTAEGQMRLFVSPASVELLGRYGWQPPVDTNPNGSVTLTLPVGSSGSSSGAAS